MPLNLKSYFSHAVVKPVVSGAVAAAADHFIMGDKDVKGNMYFGAAVAAGIASVSWVEPLVSNAFPTKTPIGMVGKVLESRIIEIACGSGAVYALNRFVLKNDYNPRDLFKKLGVIALADVAGETLSEIIIHL